MGQHNESLHPNKGDARRLMRTMQSNRDKEYNKKFGIKKQEPTPRVLDFRSKEEQERCLEEERV